jgi:hypothetical protein
LSQTLANDLEKRFPEDTLVRFNYVPTLRALLALNDRKPSSAIELLQAASPYELGSPISDSVGFAGALYPVYVRGEAYLALRWGAEAAAEFQKILDHRGIVVSDPVGAIRPKRRPPITISSFSGKTPTRTSLPSNKPKANTPDCDERRIRLTEEGLLAATRIAGVNPPNNRRATHQYRQNGWRLTTGAILDG